MFKNAVIVTWRGVSYLLDKKTGNLWSRFSRSTIFTRPETVHNPLVKTYVIGPSYNRRVFGFKKVDGVFTAPPELTTTDVVSEGEINRYGASKAIHPHLFEKTNGKLDLSISASIAPLPSKAEETPRLVKPGNFIIGTQTGASVSFADKPKVHTDYETAKKELIRLAGLETDKLFILVEIKNCAIALSRPVVQLS